MGKKEIDCTSAVDPDTEDPLVRGMDPEIRIRTKVSGITNSGLHLAVRNCDYFSIPTAL